MSARTSRRLLATLATVVVLACGVAGQATALVGPAQPDTVDTAIGALLPNPAMPVPKICGVTLVSPRVGVLAGHCAAIRAGLGITTGLVSFGQDVSASLTGGSVGGPLYQGTMQVDPAYDPLTGAHDLAVIVFDAPVVAAVPEALPVPGLLDQLGAAGGLSRTLATVVGYGTTVREPGNVFLDAGLRMTGQTTVTGVTPLWLSLTALPDQSTSCDLDSGGPVFVRGTFVAVMTLGDGACAAHQLASRVDLPTDLGWITSVVVGSAAVG